MINREENSERQWIKYDQQEENMEDIIKHREIWEEHDQQGGHRRKA